ncbi:hypothetical protein [Pseudoduganella aquatica]|uniref:Uncharacterized protein n=1 Tax=Pseudoduganella aquatica TaxID=2660641 RepID=A0A7X4KQ59_9BURK|nr:hypothetical protein [Pseudoduganella aquatica]MYN10993.1 hypothetical protein [Pseudoduganella aquatica]
MSRTPLVRQLSLLLAAGWLAAVAPQAWASDATLPSTPSQSSAALTQPAAASAFDAIEQPDPLSLSAANSFTHVYLTPAGFSRTPANDSNGSRLHLPRQDPDLDAIDPYGGSRYPARPDDEISPAALWISGLGLLTATISGILLYARNPISRKRKYRNRPGESRRR